MCMTQLLLVSVLFVHSYSSASEMEERDLTIINVLLLFLKTCRPDPKFSHFPEQQLCEISHIFLHGNDLCVISFITLCFLLWAYIHLPP